MLLKLCRLQIYLQNPKLTKTALYKLKVRKSKICRGVDWQSTLRRSTIDTLRWSPKLLVLAGSTIDTERINSQLSLSREKPIASVDPGGGGGEINNQHRDDQQSTFTFVWKGSRLCWSWGRGGRSMIDTERINSQLSREKTIASVDLWGGGGGGESMPPWPLVVQINLLGTVFGHVWLKALGLCACMCVSGCGSVCVWSIRCMHAYKWVWQCVCVVD